MRREAHANKETQIKKREKGREGKKEGTCAVRCGEWCGVVCGAGVGMWVCGCVDVVWKHGMKEEFVSISYYSRAGQDRTE